MTFYLCMTGIHTRPTSGPGKEASLKPCTLKAVFEDWQVGQEVRGRKAFSDHF